MAVLHELQIAVRTTAETVGPAVVGLGRGWGRGSGVVVSPGLVLTTAHNLRGEDAAVTFADGRTEAATVAGVDADLDVAVLAVETGSATPIAWADDLEAVGPGTPVFALADPGGRGLRTTLGMVSGIARTFRGPRGRRIRGSIEHTAPLPRGSSGGPLVDAEGRLLGLNAVRLDDGLILALPADATLRERVPALARGEAPSRPRLGVAVAPPWAARRMRRAVGLPDVPGVLVRGVEEGSPADRAGVQRGDLITAIGDTRVEGIDALHEALAAGGGAEPLTLALTRGVEERRVVVPLEGEAGGEPARSA